VQEGQSERPVGSGASQARALDAARYVSLVTFRRDGRAVATPVWHAEHAGRLYVFTAGDAGKVKRLRRDPRVRLAPCDVRGRVRGSWRDGQARILAGGPAEQAGYAALARKYGWQLRLVNLGSRLSGRISQRALLELELGDAAPEPA
jgi:PPOX class probable F420-dependent enzyme